MAETFPDWRPAPNIRRDPDLYERENAALARDGRLDRALAALVPMQGRDLLDIGCGTGFWLPRHARQGARVVGVEPDPALRTVAERRVAGLPGSRVLAGSAEHLPLPAASVDLAQARFAYFFGPGAEAGLAEVRRVLRPGGLLVAIDNDWSGGDFATLLRAATTGNAALDPEVTAAWWAARGATRRVVEGGWQATSPAELSALLRLEFPGDVVDGFLAARPPSARLSYRFALYLVRA